MNLKSQQIFSQAMQAFKSGKFQLAKVLAIQVTVLSPMSSEGWDLCARAHFELGDYESQVEAARKMVALRPDDVRGQLHVAIGSMRQAKVDPALEALNRAISLSPNDPALVRMRADVLYRAGRFDEAETSLQPALESGHISFDLGIAFASLAPRVGRREEGIALLHKCLDLDLDPRKRRTILLSLARQHDELGEYPEAFACAKEANDLVLPREGVREYSESLESMLSTWTPERMESMPRSREKSQLPVYIVGMPRSGTTLVEQILASHPSAFGANERQDISQAVQVLQSAGKGPRWHLVDAGSLHRDSLDEYAGSILRRLKASAPQALRVSDKFPCNYLHLGIISRLFRNAKIIHISRDPKDTCVSCYFHNLVGVHTFSTDQILLANWYAQYERVMDHWRDLLDIEILELRYEDFISNAEAESRRLIDFVGLPWDDRCLRFHENQRIALTPSADQVRRSIYASSVGRWEHYKEELKPLFDALDRR